MTKLAPLTHGLKRGAFKSTKTYNHSVGLSCCFRQWRAESHCRFLHGYSLKVKLEFETNELDDNNWVVDFGSFKDFKAALEVFLDHKTLVAIDDPGLETFRDLDKRGMIQLVVVPHTGCEAMAFIIYQNAEKWMERHKLQERGVVLRSVEVSEHEGNSATYYMR